MALVTERRDFWATKDIHYGEVVQPRLTADFILPWANSLPLGKPILDLGAGRGTESTLLKFTGFNPIACDFSETVAQNSYPDFVVGTGTNLSFKDGSLAGVLIKDAWIFWSQDGRDRTLAEIRRVLDPQGSVLIATQSGEVNRVYYLPNQSGIAQHETVGDEDLDKTINDVLDVGRIFSIEYRTQTSTMVQDAKRNGFECQVLATYKFSDELAFENRWVQYNGFVAKLSPVRV